MYYSVMQLPCKTIFVFGSNTQDFKDYLSKKREVHIDSPYIKGESLARVFNEIDEDHDGNITDIELIRWMRGNNFEVDLGNIAAILNFFNGDADGNTTLENIVSLKSNARKSIQGSKVLEFLGELI